MRFYADGPNIPDQRLELRDQGKVVFLCGAGVSRNEGLDDFEQLIRQTHNGYTEHHSL